MSNLSDKQGKKNTYKQGYKEHINLARKMHSQVSGYKEPRNLCQ